MANKKITELDAVTTLASTDVLPVVDVSADTTNKITTTNLFRTLPDGTAAAPSLSFASDAANGVFLAGTDTVGITTGGTQRFTVDGSGNVAISGDLTVSGTTTTVESTTVTIDDKNLELGSVATPTDTTADGGGITLKGATDHTIIWTNSTDSWDFSEHVNIASGKEFRVAGTKVLDATSLGSAVVSSSLTSVGTLGSLDVTGNITVGGTVDGRDVATDGTKLDGIETGATADQTKSDIDALGIDAATLDSIDSTSFLRSDAADTKTSGDLSFSDSVKATFGAGDDLEIYHDGSNSYIDDTGTGNLAIRSNQINFDKYTGEALARFRADGNCELFHNNVSKLETTADGVDINGTGSLTLPVGTTAQRPSSAAEGMIRRNTTDSAFEGYTGTSWAPLGGGATGGGSDAWVVETDQTVTSDYELGAGKHGTTVSPTINSGATVTVPSGAILVIL